MIMLYSKAEFLLLFPYHQLRAMVPNDLRGGKSHTNNMELYSLNQLKKDFDMCHPPASFSRVPLL